MPDGGTNRVEIAVRSIPALLAMKGHALAGRLKRKDAYDIYYCVRNYPGGVEALAQECLPLLGHLSGERGFRHIADKFDTFEGYGPTCVRHFGSKTRMCWVIARPNSGSRMRSGSLTNCYAPWHCELESRPCLISFALVADGMRMC